MRVWSLSRVLLAIAGLAAVAVIWTARPGGPDAAGFEPGNHIFAIEAQPMSLALTQFSEQAGLQLVYRADVVAGLQAGAVQGRLSNTEALDRLLAATGLSYRVTGRETVTIEKAD